MHHPVLTPIRELLLAELDTAIGKAEAQLERHRQTLALRIRKHANTAVTEALVRRARARLALLLEQRFLLVFRGQVRSRKDV